MALWGSGRSSSDLQSSINDIQAGLSALAALLGHGASAAGDTAARGARAAQETAGETANDVSATLGPVLSDLKRQIDNVVSAAGAITGRAATTVGREGKQAYKAVEGKVEDNAMLAVVAAAGVGFLIGTMVFGGGAAAKRAVTAISPESQRQPQRRAAAKSRTRSAKGRSRRAA